VQIASVEGDLALLPPFRDLHHLIIKTARMQQIIGRLSGFCALETLSLVGAPTANGIALDVSELGALRHLHIENFAPATILGPANCTLHASWDDENPNTFPDGRSDWLKSGLWASLNIPLSSFWLRAGEMDWAKEDEETLQRLMSSIHPGDLVSMELPEFGTDENPVQLSQELWSGLLGAKNVRIATTKQCCVHLLEHNPSWVNFALESFGHAGLQVGSIPGLLDSLEDMAIYCKCFCGPLSLQIAKKLEDMDREWYVYSWVRVFAVNPMYCFTTMSTSKYTRFDHLMYCGCHACLTCLLHAGKLPKDLKVPYRQDTVFRSQETLNEVMSF